MGTQAWFYVVPYEDDLQAALDRLREREFRARRYFPASWDLKFSLDTRAMDQPASTNPATNANVALHGSIDAAREAAAEDGTKSILDVDRVGDQQDWGVASPMEESTLEACFGTATPGPDRLRDGFGCLLDTLDRGEARYLIVYEQQAPTAVAFLGISYD
jgi:hypothetical protein